MDAAPAPPGRACPTCSKVLPDKDTLRRHRREAHPTACPTCGKGFVTEEGVRLHVAAVHATGEAAAGAPGE